MPMNSQQNGSAFARRILFIVLLVAALALATVYGREGQEGPIHSVQNAVIGVTGQVAAVSAGLGGATAAAGNVVERPYRYEVVRAAGIYPNLVCAGREEPIQICKDNSHIFWKPLGRN